MTLASCMISSLGKERGLGYIVMRFIGYVSMAIYFGCCLFVVFAFWLM